MSTCATSRIFLKVIVGLRGLREIKGVERTTGGRFWVSGPISATSGELSRDRPPWGRFLERVFTETERAKAMRRAEKI